MARIFGKLAPRDEFPHEVGAEPNFNESMYFNFFDPARRLGGFLRIGNRPNEGYAEMTATVFLPDGRVLFDFQRPKIADNASFDAGGTRFEVIEATESLRTTYRGSPLALREPREMTDPRHAFTSNPHVAVSIDLLHTAVGPMYGSAHDETEAALRAGHPRRRRRGRGRGWRGHQAGVGLPGTDFHQGAAPRAGVAARPGDFDLHPAAATANYHSATSMPAIVPPPAPAAPGPGASLGSRFG